MEAWKEPVRGQLKQDIPPIHPGDQVDVHYRVVEGDKERIQVFTGTIINIRGNDVSASITVRKISSGGVGVERIFPLHSPFIAEMKVKKLGSVRRAKLFYLRGLKGKAARVKEKNTLIQA